MKHMNTLEGRLGVTLFNRSNRGVELTAAGRSLYQAGKKLLSDAEDALLRAKTAERTETVPIRVGSSLLNPSKALTDWWAPLAERYPRYKFRIVPYEDTKEQILSAIASLGERMDVLVGVFNSKRMREYANYLPLGDYHLCVAVPKGHRLADRGGAVPAGPSR